MTLTTAARRVGVTPEMLRRWVRRGLGHAARETGLDEGLAARLLSGLGTRG